MILSGTTRRRTGLPGRLGLFSAAAALLPIGASWAQKADEPVTAKVVIQSDGSADLLGPVVVEDHAAGKLETTDENVVVVDVTQEGDQVKRLELSGSLEDVKRQLKVRIGELSKNAEKDPAAKAQAEGLKQALEAIIKATPAPLVFTRSPLELKVDTIQAKIDFKSDDLAKEFSKDDPEKAGEIAKARDEVAQLTKELSAAVNRLQKAQVRLRKLGGDPGATPNVRWARTPVTVRVQPRAMAGRPVPVPPGVRAIRGTVKLDTTHDDQQRLEQLEKRLKGLQDELDQLKKRSAEHAAAK